MLEFVFARYRLPLLVAFCVMGLLSGVAKAEVAPPDVYDVVQKWEGKNFYDFQQGNLLEDKTFKQVLARALGPSRMDELYSGWGFGGVLGASRTRIKRQGDLLYFTICPNHFCGDTYASFFVSQKERRLYVLWQNKAYSKDKDTKTYWIQEGRSSALPKGTYDIKAAFRFLGYAVPPEYARPFPSFPKTKGK